MQSRDSRSILVRSIGVLCFVFAVLLFLLASWMFAKDDLPGISVGDHAYIVVGGLSINGQAPPAWTFFFLPSGLCVASVCLLFAGWRMLRGRHEDLRPCTFPG